MSKKYEVTNIQHCENKELYRIKALKTFQTVDGKTVGVGDTGGFVESSSNLSQSGASWIAGDATVSKKAFVFKNALVRGFANVSGDAKIGGNAIVSENAFVDDHAMVSDSAAVSGTAIIVDSANVYGTVEISMGRIGGNADICSNSHFVVIPNCVVGANGQNTTLTFFKDSLKGISSRFGASVDEPFSIFAVGKTYKYRSLYSNERFAPIWGSRDFMKIIKALAEFCVLLERTGDDEALD